MEAVVGTAPRPLAGPLEDVSRRRQLNPLTQTSNGCSHNYNRIAVLVNQIVSLPRGNDRVVRVEDVHHTMAADERQADVDLARVSAEKPEALGHRFEGLV